MLEPRFSAGRVVRCVDFCLFVLGGDDFPSLDRVVFSLEHQLNFDIIMLIDGIQERITLKVMIPTLSAFWRQSGLLVVVSVCIRNTDSFILCVHARLIASAFDHTHTHTRTHARTHARAHARTHYSMAAKCTE